MADLGTVVITEESGGFVKKIAFAWTSVNGGGDAGKAVKTTVESYSGQVVRLVTVPDAVDAPTDNYDVAINDEDGVDILMGAGIDRDTANTEQVLAALLGYVANDCLTLSVAAAGNAKKGTVYLYIR